MILMRSCVTKFLGLLEDDTKIGEGGPLYWIVARGG